jgi:mono/diheme cytochrome c family protein
MSSRYPSLILALLFIFSSSVIAQNTPAAPSAVAQTNPQIKHVPAPYSNPTSGNEMYKSYCASCHGEEGRGDGPAAPALKTPPTDLTILAAKNGGTFPEASVAAVIQGDALTPSHGDKDMPVWGPVFLSLGQHQNAQVQLRIRNLVKYLESIQKK